MWPFTKRVDPPSPERVREEAVRKAVLQEAERKLRRGGTLCQVACTIGGVMLMAVGVSGLVDPSSALIVSPLKWLITLNLLTMGCFVVCYEAPVPGSAGDGGAGAVVAAVWKLREATEGWCKLFTLTSGRGAVYLVGGLTVMVCGGVCTHLGVVGGYFTALGAWLSVHSGLVNRNIDDAAQELQRKFDSKEAECRQAFDKYDRDRKGLRREQFRELIDELRQELTLGLSDEDVDEVFAQLDADSNHRLDFREFLAWFSSRSLEEEDEVRRRDWLDYFTKPPEWYLVYTVRPTARMLLHGGAPAIACYAILAAALLACVVLTVIGLCDLSPEPQDLGTLQFLEHASLTPVLLVLAMHCVISVYAKSQYERFAARNPPPAPVVGLPLIGKVFTVGRVLIAYSYADIGEAINFFVLMECVLIVVHAAAAGVLLSRLSHDPLHVGTQKKTLGIVTAVDAVKTALSAAVYVFYEPGWFAHTFNRLPSRMSQIAAFIIIHLTLDILQAAVSTFALYIAQWVKGRARAKGEATAEETQALTSPKGRGYYAEPLKPAGTFDSLAAWFVVMVDCFWYEALLLKRDGRCAGVFASSTTEEAEHEAGAHVGKLRTAYEHYDPHMRRVKYNVVLILIAALIGGIMLQFRGWLACGVASSVV